MNILICGVGGQGIILTSRLIAAAAMTKDIPIMSAETIGMAQKGGSVFSFLRLGDSQEALVPSQAHGSAAFASANVLYSPMFARGAADMIIAFEPSEAVRMLPYLGPDGRLIVNSHPIMPPTAALAGSNYDGREMLDYLKRNVKHLSVVDGDAACRAVGSAKALNMVMLGAAVQSGALPLSVDEVEAVMRQTVKPQFHDMNSRALRYRF